MREVKKRIKVSTSVTNHYFTHLQRDLDAVIAKFPRVYTYEKLEQTRNYYYELYHKIGKELGCHDFSPSNLKKYSVASFDFDTSNFQVVQYVSGFECEFDPHGSHYWHLAAYLQPKGYRGGPAGYDNYFGILVVLARNDGWTDSGEGNTDAPYKIAAYFHPTDKKVVDAILEDCKVAEQTDSPKIAYLCKGVGSLYYKETDVIKSEFHFDNYNENFEEAGKSIVEWAEHQESCGLAILHGEPGTGKTHYLRHLAGNVRNLTYIPSGIAHAIGDPSFIEFLSENPNRVFVIEDAEGVLVSDGVQRSSALQNLLNATDGLMGDIIKSKFIFTFNTDLKNIDKALLRPGRASVIYEFKALEADRADALLEKLGKDKKGRQMTLAEIYNAPVAGTDAFKEKERAQIGFR